MSIDPRLRARLEKERRRRLRQKHNATWGRLRRELCDAEVERFVDILRPSWEEVKDDPMRVIPAAWLAESLRGLLWTSFREELPAVQQWKYNDGSPRVGRGLLRGLDRYIVDQGFRFGLYDWGRPPERGAPPADLQAQANEGDMRARAAIDWTRYQLDLSQ